MCIYLKHIRFLSQFDQEGKKNKHMLILLVERITEWRNYNMNKKINNTIKVVCGTEEKNYSPFMLFVVNILVIRTILYFILFYIKVRNLCIYSRL